jgi:hypothetical protein
LASFGIGDIVGMAYGVQGVPNDASIRISNIYCGGASPRCSVCGGSPRDLGHRDIFYPY